MSGSEFGKAFRVVTFGESHGPYIGVVIDGIQPGLPVDPHQIQQELDRRRPGQSDIVTPRQETDQMEIISGVFEGKTTGTPICLLIKNRDQRSGDYHSLENILRPGHAGYTFQEKYGIFDYRGGGRASGRETASRVAAGAIAKQFLKSRGIEIIAYTRQIGNIEIESVDFSVIEKNPVRTPDQKAAKKMEQLIHDTREQGDSLGGVIEIVIKNCPTGLGEPVFHKIDAELAGALMSIGAVKAFEVGSGFKAAEMKGSKHNDAFYFNKSQKKFRTHTNHSGGVLGGISTGEDMVMRIAVKPPSSIGKAQKTVDRSGNPMDFRIEGRHDPCICPRIVPVAEAMVALVLIDMILLQERISGGNELEQIRSKIDTIDLQLLLLLAQRHRLIKKVSGIKKKQNLGIEDVRRENDLVQNWSKMAETLELPEKYAGQILETILRFSKQHQQDIVK